MAYMGRDEGGINRTAASRRGVLAGLAATLAAPAPAARRPIRTLAWAGRAHADVGGRALDLVAETTLELALLRVRSTSWIAAQGPGSARTLVLEPDGAWVERAGTRTPLPPAIAIHERQQYALYALLFEIQRRRTRAGGRVTLNEPPYPEVAFTLGADGYPIAADFTVDAPEDGKPRIAEHVVFSGRIDSAGVRWPRRFAITQHGKPYFTLELDRFTASP